MAKAVTFKERLYAWSLANNTSKSDLEDIILYLRSTLKARFPGAQGAPKTRKRSSGVQAQAQTAQRLPGTVTAPDSTQSQGGSQGAGAS